MPTKKIEKTEIGNLFVLLLSVLDRAFTGEL